MICRMCGSSKVTVGVEQISSKTRTRNMGCLWAMGRFLLIMCTCGLWLLVGRRSRTSNTRHKNLRYAICQDCGHKWNF